jgi:hypothetical protein
MYSKANQAVTILNSEASSRAYYINQLADASGRTIQLDTEAEVYSKAQKILGLSADEMSDFLYLQAILAAEYTTVVFGLDNAIVQLT